MGGGASVFFPFVLCGRPDSSPERLLAGPGSRAPRGTRDFAHGVKLRLQAGNLP